MLLVDAKVVLELRKTRTGTADHNGDSRAEQVNSETLFLLPITVTELIVGVIRIESRDSVQGSLLRKWLETYALPEFANRVPPVDLAVDCRCTHPHVPHRGPKREPSSSRPVWCTV